jgi:hypothetical protein
MGYCGSSYFGGGNLKKWYIQLTGDRHCQVSFTTPRRTVEKNSTRGLNSEPLEQLRM